MSKRFFPQQHGERKKAKLDITISDHNFPLSQNAVANNDADNWGDDNDDEILLMASQACEQAYGDNSTLPDFSLCMQPGATSTQLFPQPGPSKAEFHFKKPTVNSPQLTSIHIKNKCNRISSPLPGMSSKISNGDTMKYNEDLIYNDKVCKGQDADYVYRQLLQLQEENAKLKSENGKLMDKCVTREGEASILRTQLKSCQVAVDNARMEKIRAQEKVQMEWTEKLSAANGQMHDLRTQLDFKNLEIISIKEKCRMLESAKVKLTQVTVPSNDISTRHNNSQRRAKMASVGAQTDGRAQFLKLYNTHVSSTAPSKLLAILPLILEPTCEQPCLLDYNEKLQTSSDYQRNCRIFSTFHRIPATPAVTKHKTESNVTINCIHEDLTCIADGIDVEEKFEKILKVISTVLCSTRERLRELRARATAAFLRDMDRRSVGAGAGHLRAPPAALLSGRALYKEEQAILARRMVAVLAYILEPSRKILTIEQIKKQTDNVERDILPVIKDICTLLETASCATMYSGLVWSISSLARACGRGGRGGRGWRGAARALAAARPAPAVAARLLAPAGPCAGARGGVKVDFEQGVLMFTKDSCHLHILLKQIEVALKCVENQDLVEEAIDITQNLLGFYSNYSAPRNEEQENRCDCQLVLMQVIVYALRICAVMMTNNNSTADGDAQSQLAACCRGGARLLAARAARGADAAPARPALAEGLLLDFCERLQRCAHDDLYENMFFELAGTFQCAPEEAPSSFHRQAWVRSFESFSLAD